MDSEVLNAIDDKITVSAAAGIDTQLFIIEATSSSGVYAIGTKKEY